MSMQNVVSFTKAALDNRADTPGPQLYKLSNAMISYMNGELFGTAQVTAADPSLTTNGVSIYIVPPGPGSEIYCGGIVGPAQGGALALTLPMSFATSSTQVTFPAPTQVNLLFIIVYNGSSTYQTSQGFTVGP
jgi:hypothetical protein